MSESEWKEGNTYEVKALENQYRDSIMAKDPDGKIVHFRRAYNGQTGLDPSTIMGGSMVWARIVKDMENYYLAVIEKVSQLPPQPQEPVVKVRGAPTESGRSALYRKALDKWGVEAQMKVVVEEAAELTKALCKLWRAKNHPEQYAGCKKAVIEELADMQIMIGQMLIAFNREEEFEAVIQAKLERLSNKVEG